MGGQAEVQLVEHLRGRREGGSQVGGRPRFNRWSLSRSQEERKKGSLSNQVYSRQRFNRKSLSGRLEREREKEEKEFQQQGGWQAEVRQVEPLRRRGGKLEVRVGSDRQKFSRKSPSGR